jgi:hypothetical protein
MNLGEVESALDNDVWCRDDPPSGVEGFSDYFLDDKSGYCSRRDNRILMTWDSLGHLKIDELAAAVESSSSSISSLASSSSSSSSSRSSSAVPAGCYEIRVLGRFMEGPCSSSSSSSSCSSSFCGVDRPLADAVDFEGEPKSLKLCFDELGHLVSIHLCDVLRWHQDGWEESSAGDDIEIESSSSREGVWIQAYLPIDPSSSSSSCDLGITSECEGIIVNRVRLYFDSVGHLFLVTAPEEFELPCGIQTECCEDRMPHYFLLTFRTWAPGSSEENGDEECIILEWNGCFWSGVARIPCCSHPSPFESELTYSSVGVSVACIHYPLPRPNTPWWFCLNGRKYQFLGTFNCCPVFANRLGVYEQDGCDDVNFRAILSEIPCNLQCVSNAFACEVVSSSGPASGGGPGGGGPGGP